MRRLSLALTVVVLLLLVAGVGTAAANPPASQDAGQLAGSDQDAVGAAGTAQQEPTNSNQAVRVLSPGNDGGVTQTNDASSTAQAGNANATQQTADQTQAGGSGLQAIGQSSASTQDALGLAFTLQQGASNENAPVRDLSPGGGGSVTQSNEASSDATAANLNGTSQAAEQDQAGGSCKCVSDGSQVIGQSADSDQQAGALATTVQDKPSNDNVSVRVLSPGDDGPVTQSNKASSDATAANLNGTSQTAEQDQAGAGGSQIVGQSADSDQQAEALAGTVQKQPSNRNVSVRVLSPGNNGPVTQSNEASSDATAANLNGTKQSADQSQAGDSCKCASGGSQIVGQSADNDQAAKAAALTVQHGASNENVDVRVLSPGNGGPVSQSNAASSNASAGNANLTHQSASQAQAGDACKCGGAGSQIIGQLADSDQKAAALSATIQEQPSNSNTAVRVLSPGDDGPLTQSNEASSDATAANLNATKQDAAQTQDGSGLQVIGQAATNAQSALALGLTVQKGASNEYAPVRVLSHGNGGPVSQSNIASSNAKAGNSNWTGQAASQSQGSGLERGCCGGDGIQAIGQLAKNRQGAIALAATFQLGAKPPCRCGDPSHVGNTGQPTRVLSPGNDGPVRQSNKATSDAIAVNANGTVQRAHQIQVTRCLCLNDGIQASGQLDDSSQLALALAAGLQVGSPHGPDGHGPNRKVEGR
jgi:hypothetical protein